jgi:hypothetical protein
MIYLVLFLVGFLSLVPLSVEGNMAPNMGSNVNGFQGTAPSQFHFHTIDNMPRSQVVEFMSDILERVRETNDDLVAARLSRVDAASQTFITSDDGDIDIDGERSKMNSIVARLNDKKLVVKNLTLLMALVYIDRLAGVMKVFVSSRTMRKILGASIIVASKLHNNEVSRDYLAEVLEIVPQNLLDSEASMVQGITDLTIHPQLFMIYCRPLIARSSPIPTQQQVPMDTVRNVTISSVTRVEDIASPAPSSSLPTGR